MDSIERAIRDALARGNARDKAYRENVYRSVLAALERANAADPKLARETIAHRRRALQGHITAIEREYVAPAAPRVEPPHAPAGTDRQDIASPQIDAPARDEPAPPGLAEGSDEIGVADDDRLAPRSERRSRRRRPYAAMFVVATLAAALAIGAWWTAQLGLFSRPAPAESPPVTDGESFTPQPAAPGAVRDWVKLFDISDISGVITPSGAAAEKVEDDDGTYLVVRSGSGGEAVLVNVPEQLLQQLAGGNVVFDVVARSEEGRETQISISCNFGELGDCGRRRYLVGYERADYLFDVELPAGDPGADGTIAIVSDVDNEGKVLHLFEIRAARR
ncbi:MAG: hypothetical protein JJ864_05530 [Rhizobiaceae bacterium]|nr:hypothetical protein [Rhizobiaceae bacterium]